MKTALLSYNDRQFTLRLTEDAFVFSIDEGRKAKIALLALGIETVECSPSIDYPADSDSADSHTRFEIVRNFMSDMMED